MTDEALWFLSNPIYIKEDLDPISLSMYNSNLLVGPIKIVRKVPFFVLTCGGGGD